MFAATPEFFQLVSTVAGVAAVVWSFAWWLSGKFNSMMTKLYAKIDAVTDMILNKLEYHEQHDDKRFSQLSNDIWDIRVRNAARDKSFSKDVQNVDNG